MCELCNISAQLCNISDRNGCTFDRIGLNKKAIENLYKIHGKQPLQNGGERGVEETWLAFYRG